jgi:creatinine amidohydrolase
MDLVFDLCRSLLDMGFEKLAILDCHGRHDGTLDTVSQELCDATDKAVAIIKPLLMANHELNAAREFPPRGSTPRVRI